MFPLLNYYFKVDLFIIVVVIITFLIFVLTKIKTKIKFRNNCKSLKS